MKNVVFLIKVMYMGGAERIISTLANYCAVHEMKATVILTHQSLKEANLSRLTEFVSVISLEDEIQKQQTYSLAAKYQMIQARAVGKLKSIFGQRAEDVAAIKRYISRNYEKIAWLKQYFKQHEYTTIVAFLYDSMFLALLSATKKNRVIISDRGDPQQSVSNRTDMAFFRRVFSKADAMVFQSPGVQEWYQTNVGLEGIVIFNPIKDNLPEPFVGKRKHIIVNFCRISPPKNLFLLLESFEKLAAEYKNYELHIYGDVDEAEKEYGERFLNAVHDSKYAKKIKVFPARADIHEHILDSAMFVSSSDFEGMSNSMLEAMAIGLPTICTDCPAGGARAVIQDHDNGLLVPVKDSEALYRAMKEVIDKPELALRISKNGQNLRKIQSTEVIMKKWMELING